MAKCSLGLAFIHILGIKFISSTLLKSICFVSISQETNVTDNCFIWLIQKTWMFFLEIFSKFLCQINFYKQNPMWVSFGIYFQNMLSLYSSLFFYKFGHDFSHLFQSPMFIHKGRTISLWSWSNYDRENISSLLSVQLWRSIRSLPWSLIEGCVSFCHSIGSEFGLQRFDFSSNWNRVDNHFLWCNGFFWLKAFWMKRLDGTWEFWKNK